MYSKNAKWKEVLKTIRLNDKILETICVGHAMREGYAKFVTADYYWDDQLGLYVILDTSGKGDILQWYQGYHLLNKLNVPQDNLIWSYKTPA